MLARTAMVAAPEPLDAAFPRRRLVVILAAALAFYLATLWQVFSGREDWPLSPFPMYSGLPGTSTSRWAIVGVSQQGEFQLDDAQTAPFHGARLLSLSKSLEKRPRKRAEFMRKLATTYESRREAEHWPELLAIRFYRESWQIRPDLKGLDTPERHLESSMYFPPRSLLERLRAEEAGRAAPEPPVTVAPGDSVFDFAPEQCEAACSPLGDRFASGSSALRLSPQDSTTGAISLRGELPAARFFVFLRMRTQARAGKDRVRLELDGQPVGGEHGLGNYRDDLDAVGFVWASLAPAETALAIEIEHPGIHVLRLSSSVPVDLDELWLSRDRRELPSDNRARVR